MLTIKKGTTKYWYVTTSEKKVGVLDIYLFYLTHRLTNKTFAFNLDNLSIKTDRYDKFYIDETRYNLLEGEYLYEIYENSSSNNLNPNNATKLLESGILKVYTDNPIQTEYQPNLTEKVYE
jgi:hypothetical protein